MARRKKSLGNLRTVTGALKGLGGGRGSSPDRRGRRCHRAPSPLQRLLLSPLQLQPQLCFSLVAQMRPWWSPVSFLPPSDPPPPFPLNLTSAPSCPHELPSPNVLPAMATNHLWFPAKASNANPLSIQILVMGGPPFSPLSFALPRSHYALTLQGSAGAPQSWWPEAECLSYPAFNKSKGRLSNRTLGGGGTHFLLYSFLLLSAPFSP